MSVKTWLRVGATAILSLALCSTSPLAQAQEHGHGHDKHDRDDDEDQDHAHGHDRDRYADRNEQIGGWYREHSRDLPPGLAKRDRLPPGLERQLVIHGTLPPGLQKKIQPCPPDLERVLPPSPPNYSHVVIGGNLVLLNRVNFQVADVFHVEIH